MCFSFGQLWSLCTCFRIKMPWWKAVPLNVIFLCYWVQRSKKMHGNIASQKHDMEWTWNVARNEMKRCMCHLRQNHLWRSFCSPSGATNRNLACWGPQRAWSQSKSNNQKLNYFSTFIASYTMAVLLSQQRWTFFSLSSKLSCSKIIINLRNCLAAK